ncbi:hypothetical protein [Fulvivirga ligni]|uniref:hypothetical protein n=1 Tax=Fulvivirga ligni TaxID=2904246 RepID=UPI001F3A7675|nr:hypothetical protein [Fulvivirga ligni]UII19719.1 hypothetical protein LVD16_17905 [Fulvivirga ligni]
MRLVEALRSPLNGKLSYYISMAIILVLAVFPLFFDYPYRINIFLTWEGAYRMYLGQVPFKDFGLPLGYGFWLIPLLAFKLFGPYLFSLIKAQVFINIISGLGFLSILRSLKVKPGIQLASVMVYCISFSFFNFWPWYNHTVIAFQIVGMAFLLKFMFAEIAWKKYTWLMLSTCFLFLSLFTKQDGGGLALLVALALVAYHTYITKRYLDAGLFIGAYIFWALVFILPVYGTEFKYWFNYGQAPHYSRINFFDILQETMNASRWEKFYLLMVILLVLPKLKDIKNWIKERHEVVFFLLVLGIIVEALIFQVTSYTPPDNNIFFHSFAIPFILTFIPWKMDLNRTGIFIITASLILLWWSGTYWKYVDRIIKRVFPQEVLTADNSDRTIISKNTYVKNTSDSTLIDMSEWTYTKLKAFEHIYMPAPTVEGIERMMNLDIVQNKTDLKVLNMSELTPLAHEMSYELETNKPLWYHLGVGIFEEQVQEYVNEIEQKKYDLVMFETIPYLYDFYPEEVRNALKKEYVLKDRFLAPRRPTDSYIEVYVRP